MGFKHGIFLLLEFHKFISLLINQNLTSNEVLVTDFTHQTVPSRVVLRREKISLLIPGYIFPLK